MSIEFVPATVRAAGFLALMPWWQSPGQKVLLLSLSGLLAVSVSDRASLDYQMLTRLPAEFLLGLILILPALMIVNVAELLGELYDFARGQTLASAYDPTLGQSISSSAQLFRQIATIFLLTAPGLGITLGSYFHSLDYLPKADLLLAQSAAVGEWAIRYICLWLSLLARTALPLTFVFLSVDLALGFIARVLPSLSVATEGFVLKSALGLVLLLNAASFDLSHNLLEVMAVSWPWEAYGRG